MAAADAIVMTFVVIVAVKLCRSGAGSAPDPWHQPLLGQRRARYAELRAVASERPPPSSGHPQADLASIAQGLTGQPCT
jgi:hypothetical protein